MSEKSSFTIHNKSEENSLNRMYGLDKYSITIKDIDALLNGKILYSDENGEYATIIELAKVDKATNCVNCRLCKNIHIEKEIVIVDDEDILRGTYCGLCDRYDIEVSENDCCSNFEERR